MSFLKKVADTFLSTEDDMDEEIRVKGRERGREKREREEYKRLLKEEEEIQALVGEEGARQTLPREREARIKYLEEKFNPKKETEREEYERLLKKAEDIKERNRKTKEENKKWEEEAREREARIKYLEEKFNPKKDKISIIIPYNYEIKNKIEEKRKNKFVEIVKKYPNISFEEAILRSFHQTGVYYTDEYFIKKFKELSNTNSSPPKSPEQSTAPKRNSPKSSPKSPPKPTEQPTAPKRNSPKKSQSPPKSPEQPTAPKRQSPKSPPKSPPKSSPKSPPLPSDPNYELEMAFRNLEKKSKSPPNQKKTSYKNRDLTNTELENLFRK